MRRLTTYVHVAERDEQGNPGRSQIFGPGDKVPDWARAAITNPDVWDGEDDEPTETPERVKRPNRAGAGSSVEAWRAYADQERITIPDGAGRDEIIAAVEAAEADRQ